MEVGQFITFDLETWKDDKMIMKQFKSKILSFCKDPLKINEPKCTVEINGEGYGIPFSNVKQIFPAVGEQLTLF